MGKGIHSQSGIAKIKPAVVQMCEQNNLQYHVEEDNAGVIVIDLKGSGGYNPQQSYQQQQPQHHQQPQYQQQQNQHQQQQQNTEDPATLIFNILTFCFKKCFSK